MRYSIPLRRALSLLLLIATLSLLAFKNWESIRSSVRKIGFRPAHSDSLIIKEVIPGRPAAQAGILPGDHVLQVQGRDIRQPQDYFAAMETFRRGRPVPFIVRRGAHELKLRVVPRYEIPWGTLLFTGLTALCYLTVALLALQRTEDLRARLLLAFSLMSVAELVLPTDIQGHPTSSNAIKLAFMLLTGLQIGLGLHLVSLIPERHSWLRRLPWAIPFYYVVGVGLGITACATYFAEWILHIDVLPWSLAGIEELLWYFALPAWSLGMSTLLGFQAIRYQEPRGRHQAGLVLSGILPWLGYLLATTFMEGIYPNLPPWTTLEAFILLFFPVALFAAIFRYQLFDIELVVQRSLVYTTLTGVLILLFNGALGAGGALFSRFMKEDSVWSVAMATLLLGLVASPIRQGLQRVIDRRFFPERREMRQRLSGLARELPALGKLPHMGQHLVARLREIFDSFSATLLIAEPDTKLLRVLASSAQGHTVGSYPMVLELNDPAVEFLRRAHRALPATQLAARSPSFGKLPDLDQDGWAVPLFYQEDLTGILLVGHKNGQHAYTSEELELLNLLAHLVATTFENARLFESATYERLTGLLRREVILEKLDHEFERALRHGRQLTIAMADLDHFKRVNDNYGHLAGDALLKTTAQIIAESLRSSDRIGRYGGEEFLLIMPETELTAGGGLAERIRERIERLEMKLDDGSTLGATISIGLASLDGLAKAGGAVTARELLAAADRSLYEAKNRGRNLVWAGQPELPCSEALRF